MNDTIQTAIDLTRDVLDKARRGGAERCVFGFWWSRLGHIN